jgi:4-alpha-glucanotransferase
VVDDDDALRHALDDLLQAVGFRVQGFASLAWSSVATLAMVPLQDVLNLGAEARMNVPGRAAGNWSWRCTEDMLSASAFRWLQDVTKISHRLISRLRYHSCTAS